MLQDAIQIFGSIGLVCCEADCAVLTGCWTISPHSSITMPSSGSPLTLIIPIHIDNGLAISNSLPLYTWFAAEMSKQINFICLGAVVNSRYLGHHIAHDHSNKTIKILQGDPISNLLEDWEIKNCKPANVPLLHKLSNLPPCSPNAIMEFLTKTLPFHTNTLLGASPIWPYALNLILPMPQCHWVNTMLPQLKHIWW